MMDKAVLDPLVQGFASQFARHDGTLVYRAHRKGPAIPVHEAQRAVLIEGFRAKSRQAFRTLALTVAILLVSGLALAQLLGTEIGTDNVSTTLLFTLVMLAVAAFAFRIYRLHRAPERSLRASPIAAEMPPTELRRRTFGDMTYSWVLEGVVGGSAALIHAANETGSARYILAGLGLAGIGWSIVQGVRKAAYDIANPTP
jgi:hypothetical protein